MNNELRKLYEDIKHYFEGTEGENICLSLNITWNYYHPSNIKEGKKINAGSISEQYISYIEKVSASVVPESGKGRLIPRRVELSEAIADKFRENLPINRYYLLCQYDAEGYQLWFPQNSALEEAEKKISLMKEFLL